MGKSIVVHEVRFDLDKLKAMDPTDRKLMIVMGHLTNDLMAAHRLLIYCSNYPTHDPLLKAAGVCQSLLMNRLLIGMMREVWGVIEREVFRSPTLGPRYHEALTRDFPKERDELDKLKKYFGAGESKHVRRIRDRFAYHYLTHEWDLSHWDKVRPESIAMHVSQMRANSFYEFSHEAVTWAMLSEADEDPHKAFDKVFSEVLEVSRELLNVIHALMQVTVEPVMTDGTLTVHKERRVPASNPHRVRVPCFVNEKARSSSHEVAEDSAHDQG